MKLEEARVALRPRSALELLDLGLKLAMREFGRLYFKLGVLTVVPAWGLTLALRWSFEWEWSDIWMLALLMSSVLQGVFTIAAGRMMFAEEPPLREIFGAFARRLPAYLVALILVWLLLGIGLLLAVFVVPILWVWGRIAHVHEACLLEQAGPFAALKRGSDISSDATLGTGLLLVAMSLAGAGFIYVAEAFINVGLLDFMLQLGYPFGSLAEEGGSAAALLGLFLAVPYWSTVRFLAYIDRRTRRDGWDIQLRFMTLEQDDEQEGEGA